MDRVKNLISSMLVISAIVGSPEVFAAKKATVQDLFTAMQRNVGLRSSNVSQEVVANAIQRYGKGYRECEVLLSPRAPKVISGALDLYDSAPAWLIEATQKVFIENRTLSPEALAYIKQHHFLTDVEISGDVSASLGSTIRRTLLDSTPVSGKTLGKKIVVDVREVSSRSSSNTIGFKLGLTFDNGQRLKMQFREIEIGVATKEEIVAKLTVAAIYSREMLSSDSALRQEMNALRYDFMKLMRVSAPGVQQKVAALIALLEENQPKKGLFSGFLSGSTLFTGLDAILGNSFSAYLSAKEQLIEISQQINAKDRSRKGRAQFVERSSRSITRGKQSAGYYAPKAKTEDHDDESSGFETFLWIYDPAYMLSHPWYWGSKNGSIMHYWMIYDWMSNRNQRDQSDSSFKPEPRADRDMSRFDQPVDPIFTNRDDRPFANPWDREGVSPREQISPSVDRNGGVTWINSQGDETPVREDFSDVSDRWNTATGQTAASKPAEVDLNEREAATFRKGSDGSGWNQPASTVVNHPERDDSIRGY